MELVPARIVQDGCPECRDVLLLEAKSLGGLPLGGEVVVIPEHWLNMLCPHGRPGLRFERAVANGGALSGDEQADSEEVDPAVRDSRMDATKNIGYPIREHGPYGSHPMHDDFDDESGPDGSGTY